MRYSIVIVASLSFSSSQAQGVMEWNSDEPATGIKSSRNGGSVVVDVNEPLCEYVAIACVDELPPPSKSGSDGGGIQSAETPEFSAGAEVYDLGETVNVEMGAEAIE